MDDEVFVMLYKGLASDQQAKTQTADRFDRPA
jgi:hypothetical protein